MELKEYLAPLAKWWWLIAATTVIAAITSLLFTIQQPPIYQASTTVMIGRAIEDPNPSNSEFVLSQQLATTYADIARREPVRNATRAALNLTKLPEYFVRTVPNTQLMEIIVTDTHPGRAQAVADELARQLILQSPTNSPDAVKRQEFINQQLDDLEKGIQETQIDLTAKQEALATMVSARQIQDTQSQISALQSKLTLLQTNYANLLASTQGGATNTLTVIENAQPGRKVGPNIPVTVLTASGIGLVLAAGAAFLLEYLDNTVKSPEDVLKLSSLPTLSGIARIRTEDGNDSRLVALTHPRSPISEAYRKLRTGIQFAQIDSPNRSTLLITSSNPEEGKSITAANLAVVMAQAGNRVLLVDADLRRPSQHRIFELPNSRGLTRFLLELSPDRIETQVKTLLDQVAQTTAVEGLYVLTSGVIPPNPSELLGSSKMHELLRTLSKMFDYIVVDSPPVLAVTDAAVLSTEVDGVLVVAEAGRTQRGQFKHVIEQLRGVDANLVGVVLNRLSARGDGYYYYYQQYYTEDGESATRNGRGGKGKQGSNGQRLRGLIGRGVKEAD